MLMMYITVMMLMLTVLVYYLISIYESDCDFSRFLLLLLLFSGITYNA